MLNATPSLDALSAARPGAKDQQGIDLQRQKLQQAARGFEEMMLGVMYQEMFPNEDEENTFFGDGAGSGTYQQLFINELARLTAESGQLGLAEMVERDVAAQAGLTEESEKRTEPIPGTSLGRPLPMPQRRLGFNPSSVGNTDPSLASQAMRVYNEMRFELKSPVEGQISSLYGDRKDPFTGKNRRHNGLDIAAPAGTSVSAAAAGTVSYSGWKPGYGNIVIIEHGNGYETRYAHNSDTLVRKGETVTAGQSIATVGSTGRSTGPHLHFEVRKDNSPVDPRGYLVRD